MITHAIESYCKFLNFEMGITHDTPSEVAWQDVQIWNGSDEYCWRYRADTILSTDGQTDKVIPVYPPFNFVEAGGIHGQKDKAFSMSPTNTVCEEQNPLYFLVCFLV